MCICSRNLFEYDAIIYNIYSNSTPANNAEVVKLFKMINDLSFCFSDPEPQQTTGPLTASYLPLLLHPDARNHPLQLPAKTPIKVSSCSHSIQSVTVNWMYNKTPEQCNPGNRRLIFCIILYTVQQ